MARSARQLILLSCAAALLLPIAACGTEDNSDEVDEARRQGEKEGRNDARLRQLERELRKRERGDGRGGGNRSPGGSPDPAPPSGSGGSRDCGGGLSANQSTSCTFARIVRDNYNDNPQTTVKAYSPVTNQAYTMTCTDGSPHVCTGGNNATVYFP